MFDDEVISFAHGEGLRRPHPSVLQAAHRALRTPGELRIENYHFLERLPALDLAVANDFRDMGVPSDCACNIAIDAGVTRLLIAILQLFTRPDDVIVTAPGFYHPLASWCARLGRSLEVLPCADVDGGRITGADLEAWARKHDRRFFLVLINPSMTGGIADPADLQALAEVLRQRDAAAVEDAMFAGMEFRAHNAGHRLAAFAPERVITCAGASKRLGLANIRLGWACGPADAIARLDAEIVAGSATVSRLAQIMAAAGLTAPASYFEVNRAECLRRARLVEQLVAEVNMALGWRGVGDAPLNVRSSPQAGHSVLIDFEGCRARGLLPDDVRDSIDLTTHLLRTARVAFSPGASMGFLGLKLRCNFASVGTRQTYAASARWERAWEGGGEEAAGGDVEDPTAFEEPFRQGRELMRVAFLDRLPEALGAVRPRRPAALRPAPEGVVA